MNIEMPEEPCAMFDSTHDEIRAIYQFMADWLCYQLPGNKVVCNHIYDEAMRAKLNGDFVLALLGFEKEGYFTSAFDRRREEYVWTINEAFSRERIAKMCKAAVERSKVWNMYVLPRSANA